MQVTGFNGKKSIAGHKLPRSVASSTSLGSHQVISPPTMHLLVRSHLTMPQPFDAIGYLRGNSCQRCRCKRCFALNSLINVPRTFDYSSGKTNSLNSWYFFTFENIIHKQTLFIIFIFQRDIMRLCQQWKLVLVSLQQRKKIIRENFSHQDIKSHVFLRCIQIEQMT